MTIYDNSIISYVADEQRGFDKLGASHIDGLILCQLAHIEWKNYKGIPKDFSCTSPQDAPTLKQILELNPDAFDLIGGYEDDHEANSALLSLCYVSTRFKDTRILDHIDILDDDAGLQFSATSFMLSDGTLFLAFRGTDPSLTGWKEDFELAFLEQTPSQAQALLYIDEFAARYDGSFAVGGHSKGGNLAVYVTCMSSRNIRNRVIQVFDFDGPGFSPAMLDAMDFEEVLPIVDKIVTAGSVVSVVLPSPEPFNVVKSYSKGDGQHNPYTWVVEDGDFVYADDRSPKAKRFGVVMQDWLSGLTLEEKAAFTDTVFELYGAGTGVFGDTSPQQTVAALICLATMVPSRRNLFLKLLAKFLRSKATARE